MRNGNRGRFPEYSPKRGQRNYEINRSRCHKAHKLDASAPFIKWVAKQVKQHKWSLDTCVGYAKRKGLFSKDEIVCTTTLYNELWAGNLPISVFDVPEALSRKKRHIVSRKNKRIYGRSIEKRPEEVLDRIIMGHWEIDTAVGRKAGREAVVLTLVEKVSDFCIAIKIPHKDADSVMTALEVLIDEYGKERFAEIFKTVTADNGSEFERLSELEVLGTDVYFAHSYSSWERAQNERQNRILRRYVSKGTSPEGPVQYQPGGSYEENEDVTLYAIWDKNVAVTFSTPESLGTLPVVLSIDGEEVETINVEVADGASYTFSGRYFVKEQGETRDIQIIPPAPDGYAVNVTGDAYSGFLVEYTSLTENYYHPWFVL